MPELYWFAIRYNLARSNVGKSRCSYTEEVTVGVVQNTLIIWDGAYSAVERVGVAPRDVGSERYSGL